jgi:hypothetical protein
MNVLSVIVNYGSEQLNYLQEVVTALKALKKFNTTIIVHSNVPLNDIKGIDRVTVFKKYDKFPDLQDILFKISIRNRWNGRLYNYNLLPMTCRRVIDQESENYDYFLYTENDHLWLEHHIDKFIEYENILPENRISGLIQYEEDSNGKYFPAYHGRYDWDYNSVEEYGGKKFAHFTNVNQSSFIISKRQLKKIKEQHDFTQFLSKDHYRIIPKTNTDLYQYCGMKKVICISEFDDNLIHHLPNIYIDGKLGRNKLGSDDSKMQQALKRLLNK